MAVKRRIFRYSLMVCLLASAAFAAWSWLRPYDWQAEPSARCKISGTLVTPDRNYFWVHVHLKVNPGMHHDLEKPVRLETTGGRMHEPADTTFAGGANQNATELWFKFWLEPADLAGPLVLHLNEGKLLVKAGSLPPDLGGEPYRNYTSNQW